MEGSQEPGQIRVSVLRQLMGPTSLSVQSAGGSLGPEGLDRPLGWAGLDPAPPGTQISQCRRPVQRLGLGGLAWGTVLAKQRAALAPQCMDSWTPECTVGPSAMSAHAGFSPERGTRHTC